MRIVAVADTHLFHEDLVVPDGDVFVHAGDLCRAGDPKELEVAARWIRSLPHPTKIVVAGNHDWAFATKPDLARAILGDAIVYLEDSGSTIDGITFWGSPWQPEFNEWAFRRVRPRLHMFGHIHQDGGVWEVDGTCFANVTTWECERQPTVLAIDGRSVIGEVVPPADSRRSG
jgi:hypothetical protein